MTHRVWWSVGVLLTAIGWGCGGNAGAGYSLPVGEDDGGSSGAFNGGDASALGPLDAHIEENHVTITFVTLSCSGPCADVEAVATGGHAPYTFAWDDGSTRATRRVCPASNASYQVKVTDTGVTGEVPRPPETVQVPLAAKVIACPDAGTVDAAVDASPACAVAAGTSPETITPDITDNNEAYFAGGTSLPAGKYAIAYAGGCVNYSACCGTWTVNGQDGQYEYLIVGATTADRIAIAPGTFAIVLTPGAAPAQSFSNASDCVAANRMDPPYVFDFAGGKLGIYNNDFEPTDNAAGAGVGAPSFTLTACQ
jgi:hypothetical protein